MSLSVNIKKKIEGFTLDVAFEAENEFFAVLGESGCGKSLTLRCVAGIERPDTGKIVLNGKVLFDSENILICRRRREKSVIYFKIMHCFQT